VFKLHLTTGKENAMKINELLLAELDREAVGIRKTLERVPDGFCRGRVATDS
jgi:hypothetical protein